MTSSTPTLLPGGPVPAALLGDGRPATTYGELVQAATVRVAAASTHGCGPFPTATASLTAAVNYERFLALTGHHLRLLTAHPRDPGEHREAARLAQLVRRLADLDHQAGGDDLWGRAATHLAAAHDLLATHLGPAGERRTPEADVLDDPAVRHAATARVLALLGTSLQRCDQLLAHARDARRAHPAEPRVDRSRATHLRQVTTSARTALAGIETVDRSTGGSVLRELDALTPARTRVAERPPTIEFDTTGGALRVLRLLSYRQSLGEEQASPASLHDLAQFAVTATHAATSWLPEPTTPLTRVRDAVAREELQAAEAAWQAARTALGPQVRGLTRAPRLYADAVRTAATALSHDRTLGAAVLAALPRLGRDAATTVEHLAASGALVVATRQACRSQAQWRRLTSAEVQHLAGAFHTAGRASDRARGTCLPSTRSGQPPAGHPVVPEQVRRRVPTAEGRPL